MSTNGKLLQKNALSLSRTELINLALEFVLLFGAGVLAYTFHGRLKNPLYLENLEVNNVVEISNMNGQALYNTKVTASKVSADLSSFETGVYFVRIITQSNGIKSRKLIVQ